MMNQYFGDINDFHKYALLRALTARGDTRTLVCWMLTPSDGGTDGGKTSYLLAPQSPHGTADPEAFMALRRILVGDDRINASARDVRWAEAIRLIPGATYYPSDPNFPMSDGALTLVPADPEKRRAYFLRALEAAGGADLVFFDPDTGIEVPSTPRGGERSTRYVFLEEVKQAYETGAAVLVFQHYARENRKAYLERRIEQLQRTANGATIASLSCPNVVYFLIQHPGQEAKLDVDSAARLCHCW
ncbi:MAG TPA: hypothetical protein VGM37_16645 [Armatimonadota bacterium]|jgi:hypothetical protein